MTEYAWPAPLRPSRLSFYLQHNTLRFVSLNVSEPRCATVTGRP